MDDSDENPGCVERQSGVAARAPVSEDSGSTLCLRLDSRLESGREASRAVGRLCEQAGFDEATRFAVCLCTAEAVVNAVRHGYGEEAGHEVRVVAAVSQREVAISVCDQGVGLQGTLLPRREQAAKDEGGGGWGLLFMHRLMDRVERLPSARGTSLRLTKRIRRTLSAGKEGP